MIATPHCLFRLPSRDQGILGLSHLSIEYFCINGRADLLVKLFYPYFLIELGKKVDKSTFASIVNPWKDPERVVSSVEPVDSGDSIDEAVNED